LAQCIDVAIVGDISPGNGHVDPFWWLRDIDDYSKWQAACDSLFTLGFKI